MNDEISNRFDLDRLRLDTGEVWAVVPGKIKRRREYFVQAAHDVVRALERR